MFDLQSILLSHLGTMCSIDDLFHMLLPKLIFDRFVCELSLFWKNTFIIETIMSLYKMMFSPQH